MLNPQLISCYTWTGQMKRPLQVNQLNKRSGHLKHKWVGPIVNHRAVTLPAASLLRCKAAWWTHGTWSPYYGNWCRRTLSPSGREWHPGRPGIWRGYGERRELRLEWSREAERKEGREKLASKNERRHSRKDEQSGIRSGTPERAPLRAPGQFTLIHHREDAKGTAAAHSITVSAAPPTPRLSESPFF